MKKKITSHHISTDPQQLTISECTSDSDSENEDQTADVSEVVGDSIERNSLCNAVRDLPIDDGNDNNNCKDNDLVILSLERRIENLFSFTNLAWAKITKEVSLRGLEEEMKFYELIELDAHGDDNKNFDPLVDEMTEASLSIH